MKITNSRLKKLMSILLYAENELSAIGERDAKEFHGISFRDIDDWKRWIDEQIKASHHG